MPQLTKPQLRQELKLQGRSYQRDQLAAWSRWLMAAVEAHPRFVSARSALLYWPLPDEPDTRPLLHRYARQKALYLPVVTGQDMAIRHYTDDAALHQGAFGIMEPLSDVDAQPEPADVDFILVPGTAFDAQAHRLGRGAGYYDRFLPRMPHAFKLGICFPFRLQPAIPHEPHDIPMDAVLTLPLSPSTGHPLLYEKPG